MKTTKSRNPIGQPTKDPRTVFAERLSELRREKSLTVERFAETLSAKPNTVRDWLNAKVLPRSEALLAIAERFHVTTDWLLGVDGAPKDPAYWHCQ
jgi:transcriptional regulator with XRE-family HTH domain